MHSSSVLAESAAPVYDMQHTSTMQSEISLTTSSGSMTPRSHAHTNPTDFLETGSSQASDSPTFQLSSSSVSQHTHPDVNNTEISPISSQEHEPSGSAASPVQPKAQKIDLVELPSPAPNHAPLRSPKKEDISQDLLVGQKRTASGQMKRSSITSIDDLKKEQASTNIRHSRTSSMLSNGSNGSVMELSQQLRTRLSYAMYKVQSGNATQSLDELESLASQSPRSSVSGFQANKYGVESPRTAMLPNWRRKWSNSEGSDVGGLVRSKTIAGPHTNFNGTSHGSSMQAARRGLAPPANIISGNRRRPTPNGLTNGLYANGPYSPTRKMHVSTSASKQRTPSQNAAMEADAVETLLFMASPGNSGYHPNTSGATESNLRSTAPMSSQPSPLRSQFLHGDELISPPRKVEFVEVLSNDRPVDLTREVRDIDRMLDEPSSDSSDGLDEAIGLVERTASTRVQR